MGGTYVPLGCHYNTNSHRQLVGRAQGQSVVSVYNNIWKNYNVFIKFGINIEKSCLIEVIADLSVLAQDIAGMRDVRYLEM